MILKISPVVNMNDTPNDDADVSSRRMIDVIMGKDDVEWALGQMAESCYHKAVIM